MLILLAAMSRLLPHPPNFAPIGGMTLFGVAYYSKRHWAFIIPIIAMWISDLVLNNVIYGQYFPHFVWFYQGCFFTYGSFILIGLLGLFLLKKINAQNLFITSLLASVVFFALSNFGVWFSTTIYPKNISGLIGCYIAGLPFFKNTILGDLVYTSVLFGSFEYAQHKIPSLQINTKI